MKNKPLFITITIIAALITFFAWFAVIYIGYQIVDAFIEVGYTDKYKPDFQHDTIWVCDELNICFYVRPLGGSLSQWNYYGTPERIGFGFYPGLDSTADITKSYYSDGHKIRENLLKGYSRFRENEFKVKVRESEIDGIKVGSVLTFRKVDTFPAWVDIDYLTTYDPTKDLQDTESETEND